MSTVSAVDSTTTPGHPGVITKSQIPLEVQKSRSSKNGDYRGFVAGVASGITKLSGKFGAFHRNKTDISQLGTRKLLRDGQRY